MRGFANVNPLSVLSLSLSPLSFQLTIIPCGCIANPNWILPSTLSHSTSGDDCTERERERTLVLSFLMPKQEDREINELTLTRLMGFSGADGRTDGRICCSCCVSTETGGRRCKRNINCVLLGRRIAKCSTLDIKVFVG